MRIGLRRAGLGLLLVCSACATARTGTPVARAPGAPRVESRLETRTFALANGARRQAGLPDLEMRLDLVDVARDHAADMARRGYFSHYTPEGAGPGDRAVRAGVEFEAYAENLARVRNAVTPGEAAVDGWLRSPGHRRNLLDERGTGYRYTGIGAVRSSDGSVHIAQVFLR